MRDFTFTNNIDETCARLKKTLDAQDAAFNANLAAMFKPPLPRTVSSAVAPPASGGLSLAKNRKPTWR